LLVSCSEDNESTKKILTVREFSVPKRVLDIVESVTKLAELITESPLTPGALGWRACRLQTVSLSKNCKGERAVYFAKNEIQ
jgi:hypothetical protein